MTYLQIKNNAVFRFFSSWFVNFYKNIFRIIGNDKKHLLFIKYEDLSSVYSIENNIESLRVFPGGQNEVGGVRIMKFTIRSRDIIIHKDNTIITLKFRILAQCILPSFLHTK